MLGKWFRKSWTSASPPGRADPDGPAALAGARKLSDSDRELTIGFLCQSESVLPMTPQDAAIVAQYLLPRRFCPGDVMLREGDTRSNYMLWILDGDATIETDTVSPMDSITMTVLQPGSTLGQMGLMDGHKRSATCTASSAVSAAILTRHSLRRLAARHPDVAVKLMSIICMGIAERLRDVTDKFGRYIMMTHAMRDELLESAAREADHS
jgi:CRP/FNR family transcriptional regulator, cyclic AMP receptor protein